jgi:hypothetical protein
MDNLVGLASAVFFVGVSVVTVVALEKITQLIANRRYKTKVNKRT